MGETAKNQKAWKLAGVRGRLGPNRVQAGGGSRGAKAPGKFCIFAQKMTDFGLSLKQILIFVAR